MFYQIIALTLATTLNVACSGGVNTPPEIVQPASPPVSEPPPEEQNVHAIPRLTPGPHMGLIESFDNLAPKGDISTCNPNRMTRVQELRQEAISRGMTIGRALVDWSELEPQQGVYDEVLLREAISAAKSGGVSIFVTLSTLDSEGLTFPNYLVDSDQNLLSGIELDGPEVRDGLQNLLNWLVPILEEENVWAISLGNEPDAILQSNIFTNEETVAFFKSASDIVRTLDPDLPTAVTLSFSAANLNPAFTSALIDELDIMMVNFGCGNESGEVASSAVWASELENWKTAAKGKPIVIQELTCPAGYADVGDCVSDQPIGRIMATPETQADFFRFAAEEFANDDQLRAAVVFQLLDWSPELTKMFGDPIRDEGMPIFADKFEEALATVGLCRWSDGTCREAWNVWLEGLDLLRQARE